VRVGMLLCSPAGNDILFDESLTEQGRNFSTKIWNSFRLVNGWEVDQTLPQPEHSALGIEWFNAKLDEAIVTMNDHFDKYRLSDALMTIYTTIRDEFSGWLLEIVKPAYQQPVDAKTYGEVIALFDKVLRLLHPFMPFISEEIWQLLAVRQDGESIMMAQWPEAAALQSDKLERFEMVKEAVAGIRTVRKEQNIANKDSIDLMVVPGEKGYVPEFNPVLEKMGNLSKLEVCQEEVQGALTFYVKASAFSIPMQGEVDVTEELAKINEELVYFRGFLEMVMKKLGNERFVNSAPAQVVELEQKKKADAEEKLKVLEERLQLLGK